MTQAIRFGVWSPDKDTFWQSWETAGIVTIENGKITYNENYSGISTTADTWPGIIVKTPAILDANGDVITPATMVPGWHCNVIVYGDALKHTFTFGLDQYDEEGNLKIIWERTRAATFFGLTYQPANPVTGFPEGYRNEDDITYCDPNKFSSPSNIIL